jgi:hypothetical protein
MRALMCACACTLHAPQRAGQYPQDFYDARLPLTRRAMRLSYSTLAASGTNLLQVCALACARLSFA